MASIEPAEKHADDDLLRQPGRLVLQRLMDTKAEQHYRGRATGRFQMISSF